MSLLEPDTWAIIGVLAGLIVATNGLILRVVTTRTDSLQRQLDDRFAAVDKRFTVVDDRFDRMERSTAEQFDRMRQETDERFERMTEVINARLETVDHRLGSLEDDMRLVKAHLIGVAQD